MKKIIALIAILISTIYYLSPASPIGGSTNIVHADNIDNPQIHPQPVVRWGNSSYHDSLGARDPFVVKDQGTYYLYYDCTEDLLNPSFESNLGTNGWDTWNGTAVATTEKKLFGSQSLKLTNTGAEGGGAYTGNYYFGAKTDANLAMFAGLEVTPNTPYIASVYVWANPGNTAQLIVQQYRDDPYGNYTQNVISDQTSKVTLTGNGAWQRLSAKFTTSATTTAVTLSLTPGISQTSYWDGVQLERVEGSQTTPTDFPANVWFNYSLPDVIGWKTCLATSTNGTNFRKHGMLYLGGARSDWETKEKPGWVGTSGIYMSPFFYQGYWYSYTWVAGYQLGTALYTLDQGSTNHRPWYGDRRAYLPNGNPTRSGLVRSPSLSGPWERVSQSGPLTSPNPTTGWGQTYVSANGVPQLISNQWVLFLAGAPGGTFNWRTITPGLATGSTPLGPWTVTGYTPLLPPNDQNVVPEGPIYYKDQSGKHVMFVNDIAGGDALAYWTDNPLSAWPPNNRKTIVPGVQDGLRIGLSTVVEKDGQTLLVYYANRPPSGPSNSWKQYLFHDIGLATISLPLFGAPATPIIGDLTDTDDTPSDQVNLADYLALKSGFGTTYTIFDYNNLVANFGQ
jgi:hypothetical protein